MLGRCKLLVVLAMASLPAQVRAVDLTTIDRSIKKEPTYQNQPQYCLLVFGEKARRRVWLVADGQRLYIDLNGNGNLSERGEMMESSSPGSSMDFYDFDSVPSFFIEKLRDADGTAYADLRIQLYEQERFSCSVRIGAGRVFQSASATGSLQPRDAPIIHFNGPAQFIPYQPVSFVTRSQEGKRNRLIRMAIGTQGLGKGVVAQYAFKSFFGDKKSLNVTVDLEFPASEAGGKPKTRREQMKLHTGSTYGYTYPVRAPEHAGAGIAKITFSVPDSEGTKVSPGSFEMLIVDGPQDIPTLVKALQTANALVRRRVMSQLRSTANEVALKSLVEQLDAHDPTMRLGAVYGLNEWKTPEVMSLLIKALGDSQAEVRAAAASALTGYGDQADAVVPKLVHALTDEELAVQLAAASVLPEYAPHSSNAVEGLAALLSSSDRNVRLTAIRSLGVKSPESVKVLPKLANLLHEHDARVRYLAANSIASIDRKAIEPLIEKLKSARKNQEIVRELAVAGLRAMGGGLRYKSGQVTHLTFYRNPRNGAKPKPSDLTNEDLKLLRQLPDVEGFSSLNSLRLYKTPIDDKGLVHLAGLTKLTQLHLSNTRITDAGLRHLKPLTSLDRVGLRGMPISADGLEHLEHLKLSYLWLDYMDQDLVKVDGIIDWQKVRTVPGIRYAKPRAIFKHDEKVEALAFSPDCKTIATGGHDRTARLWDAATGRPRGKVIRHDRGICSVTFSPDGKTILTGSHDGTARLWNASTGESLGKVMRHDQRAGAVYSAMFSPDGASVLTRTYDSTTRLWDVKTSKIIREFKRHAKTVSGAAFSPMGQTVLTGSFDRTAQLWETATGEPRGLLLNHGVSISHVAISSDGRTALTCGGYTVRLWDTATGDSRGSFEHQGRPLSDVAFSPDGLTIVTGNYDGTARLWDTKTCESRGQIMKHRDRVLVVAFSPDNKTIATGSDDKSAQLWDATTGQSLGKVMRHNHSVNAALFSPDGKMILTGSIDGTARLWDVRAE